jgi:hypothetical protein
MKHQVEAPIDRVKDLILQEYPTYYQKSEQAKRNIIAEFVKPASHDVMYNYMKESKKK